MLITLADGRRVPVEVHRIKVVHKTQLLPALRIPQSKWRRNFSAT